MKIFSCFLSLLFLLTFSSVFAEQEKVLTWKCTDWERVELLVEKAPKKVVKPLPQKIPDIQPQKTVVPSEKKNTILIQPYVFLAYSAQFKDPVAIPGLGVSYIRDITPTFSMGGGLMYAHAFYTRSFNMIGMNLTFALKF